MFRTTGFRTTGFRTTGFRTTGFQVSRAFLPRSSGVRSSNILRGLSTSTQNSSQLVQQALCACTSSPVFTWPVRGFHQDSINLFNPAVRLSRTKYSDPDYALNSNETRYFDKTCELRPHMSEPAFTQYRMWVMMKQTLFFHPETRILIPHFENLLSDFSAQTYRDVLEIEATLKHDVKAVEVYLGQKLTEWGYPHLVPTLHCRSTSENVNNLARSCMLMDANRYVIAPLLARLTNKLRTMAHEYAHVAMLSHTHMQVATPTTMGKELANVVYRLDKVLAEITGFPFEGQWNGTVGNFNLHRVLDPEVHWPTKAKQFVETFGLKYVPYSTQIEFGDGLVQYLDVLKSGAGICGNFAMNVSLYVGKNYLGLQKRAGEVGSSVMSHKINPIQFENSEGSSKLFRSQAQTVCDEIFYSRFQRDLVMSVIMRSLGSTLGEFVKMVKSLLDGLERIQPNTVYLKKELNENYQVLMEVVQTAMRFSGQVHAYDQTKAHSQGKTMTRQDYVQYVDELYRAQMLSEEKYRQIRNLTPETYLGYAPELAHV